MAPGYCIRYRLSFPHVVYKRIILWFLILYVLFYITIFGVCTLFFPRWIPTSPNIIHWISIFPHCFEMLPLCFWAVVLQKTLERVPWTARRSNQSILKEISPEYSLEGLMLKLKLQYFGHLMWKTDSLEKTLMLGKTEGRRRGWQQMVGWFHQLNGHECEQTLGVGKGQGSLECYSPWGLKESDMTERLNWLTLIFTKLLYVS